MKALEVRNVSYRYPIGKSTVLEDISLTVDRGDFVAVIGRNGSGKTTLCNILRGFIPGFHKGKFQGEVFVEGRNIDEMSMGEIAIKIGFVFQNPFIQVSGVKKTVFNEVAYGLENLGIERDEIIPRVTSILEELKISELADKHPIDLSGGQRQRIALASVLVMDPDILIIDEPTSQLDPQGTEKVFEIIRLLKEKNKTIILVEHKMDLISEYANRVILLDDKRIIFDDKTENVLTNEAVPNHGVNLPQIAKVGLAYEKRTGKKLKRIPTTIDNAVSVFKELLQEEASDGRN